MLVEDDPDIQAVACLALKSLGGLTVEVCGGGREALMVAPRFRPDLILLDVMMPGMDGPATLAELRRIPETAATPVVFLTAKVQAREVTGYRKLGCVDVIVKPFEPSRLSELLAGIWSRFHGTAN